MRAEGVEAINIYHEACRKAGYEPPVICTPNELMEEYDHGDHACKRRRPAGEQPAGLFASITGVAERPAVGDSILPQWVVCPSCTFAATRSVSAAAACSANPATFTSSPRRSVHRAEAPRIVRCGVFGAWGAMEPKVR